MYHSPLSKRNTSLECVLSPTTLRIQTPQTSHHLIPIVLSPSQKTHSFPFSQFETPSKNTLNDLHKLSNGFFSADYKLRGSTTSGKRVTTLLNSTLASERVGSKTSSAHKRMTSFQTTTNPPEKSQYAARRPSTRTLNFSHRVSLDNFLFSPKGIGTSQSSRTNLEVDFPRKFPYRLS